MFKVESVTPQSIQAILDDATKEFTHTNDKLTTVVVVLKSGFIMTGESFCANPEYFDKDKGEEYSLDKVRDKLWELENYRYASEVLRQIKQSYQGGN